MTARVALIVSLASLASCEAGPRREAESFLSAVERFRRAENAAKPAAFAVLRAVPCAAPDVCEARAACLAFAEPTSAALQLQSDVAEGLRAIEAGTLAKDTPAARALPEKLAKAEILLSEGRDHLGACDDQLMTLKRRHRL